MPEQILRPTIEQWRVNLGVIPWGGKGASLKDLPQVYRGILGLADESLSNKEGSAILLASLYRKEATLVRGAVAVAMWMSKVDKEQNPQTVALGTDLLGGVYHLADLYELQYKTTEGLRLYLNARAGSILGYGTPIPTESSDLVRAWVGSNTRTPFVRWLVNGERNRSN